VSSDFPEIWSDDGDIEIGFSIIQGGYAGTGNLDLAPDFVQDGFWNGEGHWVDGDYRLTEGSPAIDRGTAVGAPNFDLAGRLRPQSFAHDLGAYEHTFDSNL